MNKRLHFVLCSYDLCIYFKVSLPYINQETLLVFAFDIAIMGKLPDKYRYI